MSVSIEFHFDFGSPNAYLSHLVVPALEERTGETVTYVPVLLGGVFKATNNVSPAVSLQGVKNKGEYQAIEMRRFLKAHGITNYAANPFFPVNTLQIMRGAIVAEREGFLDGLHLSDHDAVAGHAVARADEHVDGERFAAEALAKAFGLGLGNG